MATTLYLPSSGSPPLASLAVNSNWELSTGLVRLPCFISKQNTALTNSIRTWASATTQQWCWWQFQSDTLMYTYNWTTSDTFSMVIRCLEVNLACDSHLAYVVRVVSGDGSVIRGVIGLYHATSTEFATSAATRIHSARVNGATTFSSQAGDRIIVEIGLHGVTPSTAYSNTIRIGDPSATGDFALTAGLTTDLCPWVRLSRDVVFGTPPIVLTVQDAIHSHSADGTILTQVHNLLPVDSGHVNVVDSVVLTQVHSLITQDSAHSHTVDNTVLDVQSSIPLIVQDIGHVHITDTVDIIEHKTLSIQDIIHAHACDTPTLIQHYTLSLADSIHSHFADTPNLIESRLLILQDIVHEHLADSTDLTQVHLLTPQEILHAHQSTSPDLTEYQILVIQNILHEQYSNNVVLSQASVLVVQDILHGGGGAKTEVKKWDGMQWVHQGYINTVVVYQ